MAQLEDNISELLALREPRPSGFIKKTQNIASSANEANFSFVESKLLITTDIINFVSRSLKNEPVSAPRDKEQDSEDEELEPPESQNISNSNVSTSFEAAAVASSVLTLRLD